MSRYAGLLAIALSTAGGSGEEQDQEIYWGLNNLSIFLNQFHLRRYYNISFPPLPSLAKISVEQIEEEGGSEEFEAQLINKGRLWDSIINYANKSKAAMLNYFINSRSTRPM
ncbi:MAG: hypothetical protein EZS28_009477 [Streblomastix strix]|uniref:Uncharacterized protein n=1 Tax=Streblomastix strix TaxID=222440 RepID=A0A5J4WJ99_9EUKA|nr:MAG: hypothetical protein EZS28_009477 [Streblomastix strix]